MTVSDNGRHALQLHKEFLLSNLQQQNCSSTNMHEKPTNLTMKFTSTIKLVPTPISELSSFIYNLKIMKLRTCQLLYVIMISHTFIENDNNFISNFSFFSFLNSRSYHKLLTIVSRKKIANNE